MPPLGMRPNSGGFRGPQGRRLGEGSRNNCAGEECGPWEKEGIEGLDEKGVRGGRRRRREREGREGAAPLGAVMGFGSESGEVV